MTFLLFIKGLVAGALIAFPIGPIGILCLRRLLTQGPLVGIMSGLGGATADVVYSSIALLGITAIATFVEQHSILFRVFSSIFLCAFGLIVYLSKPPHPRAAWTRTIAEAYISTLLLTLTNPSLIISFIAAFSILHVHYTAAYFFDLSMLVAGVFIGSSSWWFILGILVRLYPISLDPQTLYRINQFSGIGIMLFGIATLFSILIR